MRARAVAALVVALGLVASVAALAAPAKKPGPHDPQAAPGTHDAHGGDHGPGHVNWYHGILLEREGVEPSLLFRPKGMPPPLLAMLINTGLLFYVLYKVGRRPLSGALKKRKQTIMQGIETASRMKEDAAGRLEDYESKLKHIGDEIERVKVEMREAGEQERARVLEEARERRARMERDARILIEQELKAARELLLRETVNGAVKSARARLESEVTAEDQERLADEYLKSLEKAVVNAKGGRA